MKRIAPLRENSLFVATPRGGETSAILSSLTSTCQRHGINPQVYRTLAAGQPARRARQATRRVAARSVEESTGQATRRVARPVCQLNFASQTARVRNPAGSTPRRRARFIQRTHMNSDGTFPSFRGINPFVALLSGGG